MLIRRFRHLLAALAVMTLLIVQTTTVSAAIATDSNSYDDSTTYNSLPYAIHWTAFVTYYGYVGVPPGDAWVYQFTANEQGGCLASSAGNTAYPFNQTVDGSVTYDWSGGSEGPVYSANQSGAIICDSGAGDTTWGGATISLPSNVTYWASDPAGYDYTLEYSQWTSTDALPGFFSRTYQATWH